ncbi:FAD-dependent thymidylate synthase [candidate division KSB1 bacterium]|nr:FAD-dependent thymidylate synthase [candidate division KSB1 bacterium]
MARTTVPAAEEILEKEFKCLDHGFVRLIDYMGSDESIVQAARVSYGHGTKKIRQDRGLIRYLLRHQHTTPFEMVEFKFHCKLPIFVARQWIRHRTANVNEYSLRYSKAINEFYLPEPETLRYQSETNRQGRGEVAVPGELQLQVLELLRKSTEQAWQDYQQMENSGIARELARINLPVSLYTEWYWKIDLNNLMHFLKLRLDEHAQFEIREYARIMAQIVQKVVPIAWEAFEDYVLCARTFSRLEIQLIQKALRLGEIQPDWHQLADDENLSQREIGEFMEKIGAD